jgi:hypothetical protein
MLAAGFLSGASPAAAGDRGVCISADVPEAFTLPDRNVRQAGRVVLCALGPFTPTTEMHRIWVDGEGASFLMSRRAMTEASPDSPAMLLFRRAPGQPLDLLSFVVPRSPVSWQYQLLRPSPRPLPEIVAVKASASDR